MIARAVRWFVVRVAAFAIRHGAEPGELLSAVVRAYPHRDPAWRLGVLEDAQARAAAKGGRG